MTNEQIKIEIFNLESIPFFLKDGIKQLRKVSKQTALAYKKSMFTSAKRDVKKHLSNINNLKKRIKI